MIFLNCARYIILVLAKDNIKCVSCEGGTNCNETNVEGARWIRDEEQLIWSCKRTSKCGHVNSRCRSSSALNGPRHDPGGGREGAGGCGFKDSGRPSILPGRNAHWTDANLRRYNRLDSRILYAFLRFYSRTLHKTRKDFCRKKLQDINIKHGIFYLPANHKSVSQTQC